MAFSRKEFVIAKRSSYIQIATPLERAPAARNDKFGFVSSYFENAINRNNNSRLIINFWGLLNVQQLISII